MFAVAQVFHAQEDFSIDAIFDALTNQGLPVARHEWRGLTLSVQQVRYLTPSCDVVIQADEEDFSQEEVEELADLLKDAAKDRFKRSQGRIDILPYQPDATREQYDAWMTAGIRAQVARKATLDNPLVLNLAKSIAKAVDGIIFDCTENCFVQ